MHSSIISKIEKAKMYAEERDRVSITKFERHLPRQPQQLRG